MYEATPKGLMQAWASAQGGAFDVSRVDMLPSPQHFYS